MKIFCAFLCFFLVHSTIAATPAETQDILAFADHLFAQEDYYRAITEYQRYIFLNPDDQRTPRATYQIALAYLHGEQYQQAFEKLGQIATKYPSQPLGRAAAFALANGYYEQQQYQNAIQCLQTIKLQATQKKTEDTAELFTGLCQMRLRNFQYARETFHGISTDSPAIQQAQFLLSETDQLEQLPLKKPWLAGTLSAIMPGAGQLYAERPRDAAVSFALNGILIWGTVESFNNDQYVTGGLLGIIELGWYLGNIYNAINSSHKYNRQQESTFFNKLQLQYTPPFNDPEAHPALSVNYSTTF